MAQDKTLKVSGKAVASAHDNKLEIEAVGGLVSVVVADTAGNVVWMYHPLSGWYIELDMRDPKR